MEKQSEIIIKGDIFNVEYKTHGHRNCGKSVLIRLIETRPKKMKPMSTISTVHE